MLKTSPLIILFLTVFIDLIGFGIIIPITPYLAKDFGASATEVGLLMAIYSLMQFIFGPIWGRISDLIGRRPIILMSLMGNCISYIAFAYAPNLWILFLARAFSGIFGASVSTAAAYIADVTPSKSRSKNMGLIGVAFGLGFIVGPLIGGLLADSGRSLGTQPPYGTGFPALFAALLALISFLFAYKVLEESLNKHRTHSETKNRLSKIWSSFKRPLLGRVFSISLFCGMAMGLIEAMLFLYLKDVFGWSIELSSYGFAYIGLIIVFTQGYLIRKLMPKWGERKLLVLGSIVAATGMVVIGTAPNVFWLFIGTTLLPLGNGMLTPTLLGTLSLLSAKNEQGEIIGVSHSLQSLARIVGPLLGGLVYQYVNTSAPFYCAALFYCMSFGVVLSIFKRLPNRGMNAP